MKIYKFVDYITEAKKKKKKKKKSSKRRGHGNTYPYPNVNPFGYLLPYARFSTPNIINNNINISNNAGDGSTTLSGDGSDVSGGDGGE